MASRKEDRAEGRPVARSEPHSGERGSHVEIVGRRPSAGAAHTPRPSGRVAIEAHPGEPAPAPSRPSRQMTGASRPTGQMPAVSRLTGQMPAVSRPTGQMPAVSRLTGQMPTVSRPTGQMPAVSRLTGQMPAVSSPSGPLRTPTDASGQWGVAVRGSGQTARPLPNPGVSGKSSTSLRVERPSSANLQRVGVPSLTPTSPGTLSSRPPLPRVDRIQGGLLGLLVGDALGVPYEFRAPDEIPLTDRIDMDPPEGFRRAHGVPPGTWSDDGAQALCLVASLLDKGRFDIDDFVKRLVAWVTEGYMAVGGRIFDVCAQNLAALRAIRQGASLLEAAPRDCSMNGAGSLGRVLPLALLHVGSETALVAAAHLQSQPTHPHPRSLVSCALYALWSYYELDGRDDAFTSAYRRLQQLYQHNASYRLRPEFANELVASYGPEASVASHGSTHIADCLRWAAEACRERTFDRVVRKAVSFGRAAGTTACLAGGIAGIRLGEEGIPDRWLRALRGREMLEPLLERLSGAMCSRDTRRWVD